MEMNMVYQTKRLELKILTEAAADMVLQFYLDNQEVFGYRLPDAVRRAGKMYQHIIISPSGNDTAVLSADFFCKNLKNRYLAPTLVARKFLSTSTFFMLS